MIFHFRPIPRKTKKRVFSRLCRIGKRCVFTDEGRDTKRGGAQTLRLDTPSPVKSLCEKDYQPGFCFRAGFITRSLAMRHADEYEALLFSLPYFRLGYIPLRSIIPSPVVFEKERDDDKQ